MLWYICYSLCKVWSVWLLNSWGSYKETILKGRAAKFKSGSALSCGICHFDNTSLFKLLMSIFCAKFLRYSMFLFLIFGLFWLWESRHHKVWVNVKALSLSLSPSLGSSVRLHIRVCMYSWPELIESTSHEQPHIWLPWLREVRVLNENFKLDLLGDF